MTERLEVDLPPVFEVPVEVRRGDDPASNVKVEIRSLDEAAPGEGMIETDADGRATARFRRPGRYRFECADVQRETAVEQGKSVVLHIDEEGGDPATDCLSFL